MIEKAAESGIQDAYKLWRLTPNEINLVVDAHSANIYQMNASIWQLGQYIAIGVNAPKKYPRPPQKPIQRHVNVPDEPEDEEMMKDKLSTFAKMHNAHVIANGGVQYGNAGNP